VAVFHSMSHAQLLSLLTMNSVVAGDFYFENDTQTLFIAATTTADGAVGIAPTNMLLTGGMTLGFNGAVGPAGETGPAGPTGPQGPAGSGSENNVAVESGDYTAATTINTILCTGAVIQNITLTTDGLTVGQIYTVTVLITAKQVNVVAQHGEAIEGDTGGAILFRGDSAGFMWTGSGFVIQ
jgi:hypothetical protein